MNSFLRLPAARVTVFLGICLGFASNSWGAPQTSSATPTQDQSGQSSQANVIIPGPLRSFLRMAGISQKASTEEVMPLLARNVFLLGYEGPSSRVRPTEFLILLSRYVQQARELSVMAGPEAVIRVSSCEQARPVLQVLGYRTRTDCGQPNSYLETADPQRAFITIDSGFPLPELEKALQGGKPFEYSFQATRVPIMFAENDWASGRNLLDALLRDSTLSRLYWAFAQMDPDTQMALRQSPGLKRLVPYGPVLDFYGSRIRIRSGRVLVPGGTSSDGVWRDLVGVAPESAGEFVLRLVSKDNGWLAAYYDALSRVNPVQQAHFTESRRLRPFYEALRHHDAPPAEAARSVFRPAPGLLLLLTRLQWEPNGEPRVPGNVEVWKRVLRQKNYSDVTRDWGKRARTFNNSEQLLEALVAISRVDTEIGPLQAYLMLSELDAGRGPQHRLSAETVAAMATRFPKLGEQYLIFSEFPSLDDASINAFLLTSEHLDSQQNHYVRGNALGMFQASVGMWQILARQDQIPKKDLNASFQRVIGQFGKISSSTSVFDAGRSALKELLVATTHKPE